MNVKIKDLKVGDCFRSLVTHKLYRIVSRAEIRKIFKKNPNKLFYNSGDIFGLRLGEDGDLVLHYFLRDIEVELVSEKFSRGEIRESARYCIEREADSSGSVLRCGDVAQGSASRKITNYKLRITKKKPLNHVGFRVKKLRSKTRRVG